MHKCLGVPEIAEAICQLTQSDYAETYSKVEDATYVHDNSDQASRKTALSLALTCKSFYDPAVSVIWHTLQGMQPLIRCMDNNLFRINNDRTLDLLRPIYPSDVQTMQKYTHRIRRMRFSEIERSHVLPNDVYHMFNSIFAGQPWLPKLHILDIVFSIEKPESHILPFVDSLLPSSLKSLTIWTTSSKRRSKQRYTLLSFLSNLPLRHPHILRINLCGIERLNAMFFDVIQTYHSVIHLSIPAIDCKAMQHLGAAPFLEHLQVDGERILNPENMNGYLFHWPKGYDPEEDVPSDVTHPSYFPSLRTLKLTHLDHASKYEALLSCLAPGTRLKTLDIDCFSAPDQEDLFNLIQRIAVQISRETLTNIRLDWCGYSRLGDSSPFDGGALRPLTRFTRLEYIEIHARFEPYICDQDIHQLCSACPMLVSIDIQNYIPDSPPPNFKITIAALIAAAQNCRKLRSLTLNVDASNLDLPVVEAPVSTALDHLRFRYSPIGEPAVVAVLLHKMFPNVSVTDESSYAQDWFPDPIEEAYRKWAEVASLIDLMNRQFKPSS